MKKIFTLLISAILSLSFLTGCSTSNSTNAANNNFEGRTGLTTLAQYRSLDQSTETQLSSILDSCDQLINTSMSDAIAAGEATQADVAERTAHMERVTTYAVLLMKALEQSENITFTNEEAEDLMIAAYTHDIKKFENNHEKKGAKYIKQNLPDLTDLSDERIERISTLIKYHSDTLTDEEKTELDERTVLLIQLLQDADATDKILYQAKNISENYALLNLQSTKDYVDQSMNGN